MKLFFKHLSNVDSDRHIRCMLVSILFLSGVILLGIQLNRINGLSDDVESYKNLFLQEIHQQNLIIIDLQDLNDEQSVLNASFNKRIHNNFNHTNDNYADILENHMRIDEVSYEGLLIIIEEFEKDIELLKRGK